MDEEYDLSGKILKYKSIRRTAYVVLIIGLALGIAGAVMLGIGIKKKHDADNKSCSDSANVVTCPVVTCSPTTTSDSETSGNTNAPTNSQGISTSSLHSTTPGESNTATQSENTCPPCACTSIFPQPTTINYIPENATIPLSSHHPNPVSHYTAKPMQSPVTEHPIGHKTTQQFKTTPINYPGDPSYYPCLANIVIAFEAAGDISTTNIYNPQIDFITNHLLVNNSLANTTFSDWNNPNRVAYAAFERSTIHWQKFHHFTNLADLRKSIDGEKQIFGVSGYDGIFDVLLKNITFYDTQGHFVNTVIFTSNADGTDIHKHVEDAQELNRRGRLIIVTTKPGIKNEFRPWTNNDDDRIFYFKEVTPDSYPYEAYKIVNAFNCPNIF